MDTIIPNNEVNKPIIALEIVTDLKLLNNLNDEAAGKITKADINNDPTKFMANTITDAMMIAKTKLYNLVFSPDALVKSSSKVIAKIRL